METTKAVVPSIQAYFGTLTDPRDKMNQEHLLLDLVVIAICAIIACADDWVAVADFAVAKEGWLRTILALPGGIPAHDTFWRVFRFLNPEEFEDCFLRWIQAVSAMTQGQVIAIDGKKLRHSYDKGSSKAAIHMVSAWASVNRLTLAQRKVDDKSNEITAIPELLNVLEIAGCIVTIDAMGCQTEIAETIIEKDADYLLALKENQGNLYADVELLFTDLAQSQGKAYPHDYAKSFDKDHGRIEIRQAWSISDPQLLAALRNTAKWPHLHTLLKIQSERIIDGKRTLETRYFISSLQASAEKLLDVARTHWSIENSCHWVLDIAFREDESRLRKGFGAQNFAILRHIALNCLKQEHSARCGIKNKRLRAAWDNDYLLSVLSTLFP